MHILGEFKPAGTAEKKLKFQAFEELASSHFKNGREY